MPLTYLAHVNIRHLAETALQTSAAGGIHIIPKPVHPVNKVIKTAEVWRCLTAKESLFGHSRHQLASNEVVCLVAKLLHKLMSEGAIENVVLNGHIFVIQLRQEAQRGHV